MSRERLTVTVEEAGKMLGISRGSAYRLAREGQLPSLRLGRRLVVPMRQLHAMLAGEELNENAAAFEGQEGGEGSETCHASYAK